jgi:hypothetical protein
MSRIQTTARARTGPRNLSEDYGNTWNDCGNSEMTSIIKIMKERLQYINSKLWRGKWRNYGQDTHNWFPNFGTSKNSTLTGDDASWTYGMKARNVGQRSQNYTWTKQKITDTAVSAISIRPTDWEQEWDNRALTQLLRAGIVAYFLLPSFGTISLVKAQLK